MPNRSLRWNDKPAVREINGKLAALSGFPFQGAVLQVLHLLWPDARESEPRGTLDAGGIDIYSGSEPRGGHDIPEETIRERWVRAPLNIARLLPHLSELRVFDNSADAEGPLGAIPPPRLLLHWSGTMIVKPDRAALLDTPDWARDIVAAAIALEKQ